MMKKKHSNKKKKGMFKNEKLTGIFKESAEALIFDIFHENIKDAEGENAGVESAVATTTKIHFTKKIIQKRMQKKRNKKIYAKDYRNTGKSLKDGILETKDAVINTLKNIPDIFKKNISTLTVAGVFLVLLILVMILVSSCGSMFMDGISITLSGAYMSEPKEIDATELYMTELEMELQKKINNVEIKYPDYDEYRYNIAPIVHDPYVLISYFSALYTEFTFQEIRSEVESLFYEMYDLTLIPVEEIRVRVVTKTGTRIVEDPITGEEREEQYEYEAEEEYTVHILEVTLTAQDLNFLVLGRLNDEQRSMYELYTETHGLIQHFYSPLDLYWYNYVSSYYGYRINAVTEQEELYRGIDITVPVDTDVYASMDGIVTEAGIDSQLGYYVVIDDENGYCTKYASMASLNVVSGQNIRHGAVIGTTGNQLYIECQYNGDYYNPLFYFEAGSVTIYGEEQGAGSGGGSVVVPDSYDDAEIQTLMEEAAKYLGYPYVWGGSSPSTSFDCSGFVCWVFSNSGIYDLPRTSAQGIYNQSIPIPVEEAKAGDIICFTGTYNSDTAVSHIGIYCGNGVMIHCGDPIKYSNINTSYWQNHFYGFGRLN